MAGAVTELPVRFKTGGERSELKSCIRCKESKAVSDFGKRSRSSDGRNSSCRECERSYNSRYRNENRQKIRDHSSKWRNKNRETARERSREWREAFPDRQRRFERKYRLNNLDRRKASKKLYRSKPGNVEKDRLAQKRWAKRNKPKIAAKSAARRALRLMATPSWANLDAINEIYEEAKRITVETGIPHEVDHYYPLKSKLMCGLHCEANLRIVMATVNRSKSNKHPDISQ